MDADDAIFVCSENDYWQTFFFEILGRVLLLSSHIKTLFEG